MGKKKEVENDVFLVRESVVLDFIVGGIFLVMFFSALTSGIIFFAIITLGSAVAFIVKGSLNKVSLAIDCNGIYKGTKLITNWRNFEEAHITQAPAARGTQDNFVLIIRYFKEGIEGNFKMTIPLTNTQNKSEEEVLKAIQRFYQLYQEKVMPVKQPFQIGG
jgi:hypothetical protein